MGKTTLECWLETFGFRDNPFSSQEAGSEDPDRLNKYFVAPPYFDEILGSASAPQTTLIFAPRGCGKTAQRVMMDYNCRNNLTRGSILSVPYTDFSQVMDHREVNRDPFRITSRHHAVEILKQAMLALAGFLAQSPIALKVFSLLPDLDRIYLSWFVSTYSDYLTFDQINTLSNAEILSLDSAFSSSIGFLRDKERVPARMIQALEARKEAPPAQLFNDLSRLLASLGFEAIYILVDRVDEFQETAADPTATVALIEPLLADLTLMELPRLAFKFFLPLEMEDAIRARPAVRLDRLSCRHLEWTDDSLLEVLRKRLEVFGNLPSLDAVCVPELRGRVEREMVEMARGSPRHLIRLAGLLLSEHCKLPVPEGESEWFITEEAWRKVQEKEELRLVPADKAGPPTPPLIADLDQPVWSAEEAAAREAAWNAICELETGLRRFVAARYEAQYGENWMGRVNQEMRRTWAEARAKDERTFGHYRQPAPSLLDYSHLGDLLTLINAEWGLFRDTFGPGRTAKRQLQSKIEDILRVRNPLAHNRAVPENELKRAEVYCNDLLMQVQRVPKQCS